MTLTSRRGALKLIGASLVGVTFGAAGVSAQPGPRPKGALKRQVVGVRAATAPFTDPAMATEAGYATITPFVCGMGFHWGSEAEIARLLGGGSVDPLVPPVINYGEDEDGNLVLGAVEYFAPTQRFDADGNLLDHYVEPPDLFADEGVGPPHHEEWELLPSSVSGLPVDAWALHLWAHRRNPDGMFAPMNPRDLFNKDDCVPLEVE